MLTPLAYPEERVWLLEPTVVRSGQRCRRAPEMLEGESITHVRDRSRSSKLLHPCPYVMLAFRRERDHPDAAMGA